MALIRLNSYSIPAANLADGTDYSVRYWYNFGFIDSAGQPVQSGTATTGTQIRGSASVANGFLIAEDVQIYTTVDSQGPSPQSITLSCQVFKGNSALPVYPFRQSGCPSSWIIYNPDPDDFWELNSLTFLQQASYPAYQQQWMVTNQEMIDYVNSLVFLKATALVYGITRLSLNPAVTGEPVAVGDNDPRLDGLPIVDASATAKGITKLDVDPDVADDPIAVGVNSPLISGGAQFHSNDYASLQAAVVAIGDEASTLIIQTDDFPSGTSCTVPTTLVIDWGGIGALDVATGQTVTIESDTRLWPIRQIFNNALAGEGTVSLADNTSCPQTYAEWWGAQCTAGNVQTGDSPSGATITGASDLTNDNIGDVFVLQGAGVAGAPLVGAINAILSSTSFTSSVAASTTVTNNNLYWGVDCTTAFAAAIAAMPEFGELALLPPGYIANISLTKPISIKGYGSNRPALVVSPLSVTRFNDIAGVVIRAVTDDPVLDISNVDNGAQGMSLSNVIFDGGRIAEWVISADRMRYSDWHYVAAVRGATGGVRLGAAVADASTFDLTFFNTFNNLIISSCPTGLALTKWDAGQGGATQNTFTHLTIDYDGQGTDDAGMIWANGDGNSFYEVYIWDHVNVSPKPGLQIDTWTDIYSQYNNKMYGGTIFSINVDADAKASFLYNLDQYNGMPDPTIGAGGVLEWTASGFSGTVKRLIAADNALGILSGKTNQWSGLGIGRAALESFMAICSFANLFVKGDAIGDLVFRMEDRTKKIIFGYESITQIPTFAIVQNYISHYTDDGEGTFIQNKDGDPSDAGTSAWSTGFSVPGGSVVDDHVISYWNGANWTEKIKFLTAGSIALKTAGEGVILKSPDGTLCKKLTIDNAGAIVLTTVTCP